MAWGFHFFKKSGACGAAGAAGACGFRILNLKHKNQNTWKRLLFSDILFFFFFVFFSIVGEKALGVRVEVKKFVGRNRDSKNFFVSFWLGRTRFRFSCAL